jgi:hypothetical protein
VCIRFFIPAQGVAILRKNSPKMPQERNKKPPFSSKMPV